MTSELDEQARNHGDVLLNKVGEIYREHFRNWPHPPTDEAVEALAVALQAAIEPYLPKSKAKAIQSVSPTVAVAPVNPGSIGLMLLGIEDYEETLIPGDVEDTINYAPDEDYQDWAE